MLKRLSFALVAISFTVPVVACLNAATDEKTSGDANMLTDAEKAACNFGFAEVAADAADPTFDPMGDKGVFTSAKSFAFGDADGDHKVDLLMVSGRGEVSLFPGKGDGRFGAAVKTAIDAGANATPSAVSLAGMGDFDGDGLKDFVALSTVFDTSFASVGHYVIGFGKTDGTFQLTQLPFSIPSSKSATALAKWTSVADLDGDGKDDLVVAGTQTEAVYFGGANRKFTLGKSPLQASGAAPPVSDRVLTFATAKAGLIVNNANHSWKVTFAADRKTTVVDSALAVPNLDMRAATDLDGDDRPELTLFDPGHDSVMIAPLGDQAPAATKFVKFPGTLVDNADFGLDLAHDQKHELIYKTDARKLFAACGYSATTQEIVGVELPVALGDKTTVIGTPDLNGDGKPDFITFNFDAKALKVSLGAAPPAVAPPQISYYAEGFVPPVVDAGPPDATTMDDGSVVVVPDSGPGELDAGPTDAGTDSGPKDAGKDSGPVDAGKDAGPKPDAGKDAGPKPPVKDAGQTGDDDDDTTSGDDDDDGPAKPKDAGKPGPKPSGTSSSSTSGSVTVTVTKKDPPEDDGGCSTAPGRTDSSGSVALGGMVALFLLGGRRRRKSA